VPSSGWYHIRVIIVAEYYVIISGHWSKVIANVIIVALTMLTIASTSPAVYPLIGKQGTGMLRTTWNISNMHRVIPEGNIGQIGHIGRWKTNTIGVVVSQLTN
jgi:hypothetical protein